MTRTASRQPSKSGGLRVQWKSNLYQQIVTYQNGNLVFPKCIDRKETATFIESSTTSSCTSVANVKSSLMLLHDALIHLRRHINLPIKIQTSDAFFAFAFYDIMRNPVEQRHLTLHWSLNLCSKRIHDGSDKGFYFVGGEVTLGRESNLNSELNSEFWILEFWNITMRLWK